MTKSNSEIRTVVSRSARRLPRAAWLLAGLALLVAGCKGGGPGSKVFVRNGAARRLRIAVLPFISPANAPGAGDSVTTTVITYLLSTGVVEVVEPGLVDRAMRTARYVPQASGGLDLETLGLLQQQLQVDAYLVGAVDEFGEVRIGPDTYPSVSFSARLIRASDACIIWAASISRTGADSVKVFDIGRVSSLSKLTMAAVAELAQSLGNSTAALSLAPSAGPAPVSAPVVALTQPNPSLAPNPAFLDETRAFGAADLKALLRDVPGFKRGQVTYTKHFNDTVTALYGADHTAVDVKLVDYAKADVAAQFVQKESAGRKDEKVAGLPAFSGSSSAMTPGYFHLNVAVGRFGLYLTGPESVAQEAQKLAAAIITMQ